MLINLMSFKIIYLTLTIPSKFQMLIKLRFSKKQKTKKLQLIAGNIII